MQRKGTYNREMVSIHVPTRGTTKSTGLPGFSRWRFNPRSHEGNDENIVYELIGDVVSIHVPTRGTTKSFAAFFYLSGSFNPRSHEGNDYKAGEYMIWTDGFNPRSHEGNDGHSLPLTFSIVGFQSTFPRGERRGVAAPAALVPGVSIHVPTRGTTATCIPAGATRQGFNPRSHEGNDSNHL